MSRFVLTSLLLLTVMYSSSVFAAPSLTYSTMVVDSIWKSEVTAHFAADVDREANLYIAVSLMKSSSDRCIRVFRVDPDGRDVSIFADIDEDYFICNKIICGETGVYVLVEEKNIVKFDYDGNEVFKVNWHNPPYSSQMVDFFIDNEDNLYYTFNIGDIEEAASIPVTVNAIGSEYNGGYDIVFQKYDSQGNLLYSSFLGGSEDDFIAGSHIDGDGVWYQYIFKSSDDFSLDIEGEPLDKTYRPCIIAISPGFDDVQAHYSEVTKFRNYSTSYCSDDFLYEYSRYIGKLSKFSNNAELIWSMDILGELPLLGMYEGNDSSVLCAFDVGENGRIYIVRTVNNGMPFTTTPDALYSESHFGSDFGIWEVTDNAELLYGTYFGGSNSEVTTMHAVSFRDGKLYVAGYTHSPDFPLTPGAYIDTRTPPPPGQTQPWGLFAFCIDFSGQPVAVDDDAAPTPLILDPPHPNPFNPQTTISFTLPEAGLARLAVYDISGQLVRELTAEMLPAGRHEIVWDGRDATGATVGSGVYIARLTAGEHVAVRKVTLVR